MITRAHPRVRGDVSENPWRRHLQKGSPPRARGRRPERQLGELGACTHPRVRGDVVPRRG